VAAPNRHQGTVFWNCGSRAALLEISSIGTGCARAAFSMVPVGILILEIRLNEAHSLKDKRRWVKALKDRLRAGHNISVAEVDEQDLWNASTMAVVTVSGSRQSAAKVLESCERIAAAHLGSQLASATLDWLD
jgi:uncharacterized protein YlxP (DUF503 family)